MNYVIQISPDAAACRIATTGRAVGGDVYPSLKIARAHLEAEVRKHCDDMRTALKEAVKVREVDLPSDDDPAPVERAAE